MLTEQRFPSKVTCQQVWLVIAPHGFRHLGSPSARSAPARSEDIPPSEGQASRLPVELKLGQFVSGMTIEARPCPEAGGGHRVGMKGAKTTGAAKMLRMYS